MVLVWLGILPGNAQINLTAYGNSNEIRALCEDDNYIWMATNNGLIKRTKNGVLIAHLTSDNSILPSNDVFALAMDHNATLWIGTALGVCAYNKYTSQWKVYNTSNGLPGNKVKAIAVDLSGNVWIGNYSPSYLTKFDGTKFTRDSVPAGGRINAMAVDSKNNLWICTARGVYKYDYQNWENYYTPQLPWKEAFCIAFENGGRKWIGTSKGLCRFNDTTFKSYFVANGLADDNITSITIEGSNKWFSTINGITKFDNTTWTTYNTSNSGLVNNTIMSSLLDVQGNLWFGTAAGLSKKSTAIWTTYTADGLAGSSVYCTRADKYGNIWFATDRGVSVFNGLNWKTYTTANGLIGNNVYSIGIDSSGIKWFGTADGVSRFNDTVFTNFTTADGLAGNLATAIAPGPNGKVWFATATGGISVYNGSVWKSYSTADGLASNVVNAIVIDKNGNPWIGTNNGLSHFNGTTFTNYNVADGLVYQYIYSLALDSSDRIWIGTYYGVSCFDGSNWKTYTTANGLAGNITLSLLYDKTYNELWFGSNSFGIARYNMKDAWEKYTIADGLSSNIIYSLCTDNQGTIWAGTTLGVSKAACENAAVLFKSDTACLPVSVSHLTSVSQNTDKLSLYKWTFTDNGVPLSFDTSSVVHKFTNAGLTNVKLEVKNRGCSSGIENKIIVGIKPDARIQSDLPSTFCYGQKTNLSGIDNNKNTDLSYSYLWSTGVTTDKIIADTSGTYTFVVNDYACKDTASITLVVRNPYQKDEICMVTVDSATGKNKIIWSRTEGKNTQSYNIYKVFGIVYQPIGNTVFDSLSVFIDYTSIPESMIDRYALSAIDSCGNESEKSPFHQTMLLQAAKGTATNEAVLDWSKYIDESGKWIPEYYYIYKGKTKSSMVLIDSVSGLLETRYNDQKFDGISAFYQCRIRKKNICEPAKLLKADAGPYSQSLSNIVEFKTTGLSPATELHVSAYPNPFTEKLTIECSLDNNSDVLIEIVNATGQKTAMFSYDKLSAGAHQIKLSAIEMNIPDGLCYVRIIAGQKISVLKCNYIR